MEKRRPTYDLEREIKTVFIDERHCPMTGSASTTMVALGLTRSDVVAVVQGLKRSDFEKSMTTYANHKVWQDVYKPRVFGLPLYVKFQRDANTGMLLVSFKEVTP